MRGRKGTCEGNWGEWEVDEKLRKGGEAKFKVLGGEVGAERKSRGM